MLDLTARTGNDSAVGLVEEIKMFAPELDIVKGRPVQGTSYRVCKRVALAGGAGKVGEAQGKAFRKVGAGSTVGASKYIQEIRECFFVDGQMEVDEAIVQGDDRSVEDVLAAEGAGQMRAKAMQIGAQFYYGTNADADGFQGLEAWVDSTMIIDAGGGAGGCTYNGETNKTGEVYMFVNDPQNGLGFVFGKTAGLQLGPWTRQRVSPTATTAKFAYVNNAFAWMGLELNYSLGLARIINIDDTHPLTDKLIAQALAKFPVGIVPTHIMASRWSRYLLQTSRAPVYTAGTSGSAITAATALQFPQTPTESQGVPLFVTDSIKSRAKVTL
jgi:hypothetical protein